MVLDPDLKRLQKQTIYVAKVNGKTNSGDSTYGSPAAVKCRCVPAAIVTDTSATGEETVSEVMIETVTRIDAKDHIWLPGVDQTNASLARVAGRIDELTDEDGTVSHYEVLV